MTYTSWRPRNETPEDLEHEAAAARIIESVSGLTVHKLSESLYAIDWALARNERPVAWGEFKRRDKRYKTLLLSAAKWEHGTRLATAYRIPFIVVVQWPDGLFAYKWLGKYTPKLEVGGNSRGQNGDTEPCVHIPVHLFTRIAT